MKDVLSSRGSNARHYNLDAVELDDAPSQWEQDRQTVYLWAKRFLSWGQVRKIPIELLSNNLRCSVCEKPRAKALYVSFFRDLYCERHYKRWLYTLRKKPRSKRYLQQQAEQERIDRDHYACWHDIR